MVFTVMHMNEPVAVVELSEDKRRVDIRKLVPDSVRQPFSGNKLDLERVYSFLKSRCYEDGRSDLAKILDQAGLSYNNPWEWIKITHGVTYEDLFWIRFPGETILWEDVKVR